MILAVLSEELPPLNAASSVLLNRRSQFLVSDSLLRAVLRMDLFRCSTLSLFGAYSFFFAVPFVLEREHPARLFDIR